MLSITIGSEIPTFLLIISPYYQQELIRAVSQRIFNNWTHDLIDIMPAGDALLISASLALIVAACLSTFTLHNVFILAQETKLISTLATYYIESDDVDAFEENAKRASDSAIELIEKIMEGPITKNITETAETAKAQVTDDFTDVTQNLTGLTSIKDYLRVQFDKLIEESKDKSTHLGFKIKIDTECKSPNVDCVFKIYLLKA